MDITTIMGLIIIAIAIVLLVGLTVWSVRRINRINSVGPRSAREILHAEAGESNG